MTAEPANSNEPIDHSIKRNARYGLMLFTVYFALYGSFIGLNLAAPKVMATPVAGMNLAIVFGFSLILAAIGLALVYMWMCAKPSHQQVPQ